VVDVGDAIVVVAVVVAVVDVVVVDALLSLSLLSLSSLLLLPLLVTLLVDCVNAQHFHVLHAPISPTICCDLSRSVLNILAICHTLSSTSLVSTIVRRPG
jgi:hypothetical protein